MGLRGLYSNLRNAIIFHIFVRRYLTFEYRRGLEPGSFRFLSMVVPFSASRRAVLPVSIIPTWGIKSLIYVHVRDTTACIQRVFYVWRAHAARPQGILRPAHLTTGSFARSGWLDRPELARQDGNREKPEASFVRPCSGHGLTLHRQSLRKAWPSMSARREVLFTVSTAHDPVHPRYR